MNELLVYLEQWKVSKSKIFDYKRNDMANQDKYNDYIEDPETLKLLKQKILEKSKKYNPLGLDSTNKCNSI